MAKCIVKKRCLLQSILDGKRISHIQLYYMTGLSPTQISLYAGNKRSMTLETAYLIAYHLKCHIDDLFEWEIIE